MCSCFNAARSTSPARAAANIDAIVAAVRTGDVLLYDDASPVTPPSAWTDKLSLASRIVRILSALPCSTYTALEFSSGGFLSDSDEPDCGTPRSTSRDRPVVGNEWLAWSDAAIIVCVEAEPGCSAEPVVFVRAADNRGDFVMRPLRTFVNERVVKGAACAVRHLLIVDEESAVDELRRNLYSQRRANLREKIFTFHRSVYAASQQRPDTDAFFASIARALIEPTGVQLDKASERALVAAEERDYLPLLRASSSYLVMQTLYAAQVVRIDPRTSDAARLLQSSAELKAQLASEYRFSAERTFAVN